MSTNQLLGESLVRSSDEGVDTITDFDAIEDQIQLIASGFSSDLDADTNQILDAERFALGSRATNANQRIIYDQISGVLSFDADGNGALAAIPFAQLTSGAALSAGDIGVV